MVQATHIRLDHQYVSWANAQTQAFTNTNTYALQYAIQYFSLKGGMGKALKFTVVPCSWCHYPQKALEVHIIVTILQTSGFYFRGDKKPTTHDDSSVERHKLK